MQAAAQRLTGAVRARTATTALTADYGDFDIPTAYDLQALVVADRIAQGNRVIGAKLGLTSEAKQKQMSVSEPLYGWLTDDMRLEPGAPLVVDRFIQPRVEAEIAFLIGDDL
jgi:2-oxo-3-hexenedioate decarboxylase